MRKVIHVSAVALVNAEGKVFLAQRPPNKNMADLWEFPGGKIKPHETPEEALIRELKEELGITLLPEKLTPLSFVSHAYDDFYLVMLLYLCDAFEGEISLSEHQASVWVLPSEMGRYPMPPADLPLVPALEKYLQHASESR